MKCLYFTYLNQLPKVPTAIQQSRVSFREGAKNQGRICRRIHAGTNSGIEPLLWSGSVIYGVTFGLQFGRGESSGVEEFDTDEADRSLNEKSSAQKHYEKVRNI